jgi:hypothetical protein
VKKKRDKRKVRGKGKLLSDEAKRIARFLLSYEAILNLPEHYLPQPDPDAIGAGTIKEYFEYLQERFVVPAILRRAKNGTLSEIDRATQKLRKVIDSKKVEKAHFAYWEYRRRHSWSKPTNDELIAGYCEMTGEQRTETLARKIRDIAEWLPMHKLRPGKIGGENLIKFPPIKCTD